MGSKDFISSKISTIYSGVFLNYNKKPAYTVALTDFFRRKKINCVRSVPFHQGPHHQQLPPSSIQLVRDIIRRNAIKTLKNVALKKMRRCRRPSYRLKPTTWK